MVQEMRNHKARPTTTKDDVICAPSLCVPSLFVPSLFVPTCQQSIVILYIILS